MALPLAAVAAAAKSKLSKEALKKGAKKAAIKGLGKQVKKKSFIWAFVKIIFGIFLIFGGTLGTVGSTLLMFLGIGFITAILGVGLVGTGVILLIWGVIDLFRAAAAKTQTQINAAKYSQWAENKQQAKTQQQQTQEPQQKEQQPNADASGGGDKGSDSESSGAKSTESVATNASAKPVTFTK